MLIKKHARGQSSGRRGSQMVEAGLMLVPFLAMAFISMDAAWALFIKATLQHAVREGVRYAVTGQVSADNLGQIASIEAVVQKQSLGLLTGSQAGTLSVTFLDPVTLMPSTNQGGNLVEVSVTNYQIAPLAPLLRSSNPTPVSVTAVDMIEGSPGGVTPNP